MPCSAASVAAGPVPGVAGSGLTVLVNRSAGSGSARRYRALGSLLREAGVPAVLRETEPDQVEREAARLARAGMPVVVVGGGDGTVRAAADALAGTGTALSVIPLGTLNHFARRVGVDRLREAADSLRWGGPRPYALGIVDEHVFLCTATIGFYSDAVRRRDRLRPRWGRLLAAGVGLAAGLRRMHVLRVVLEADDLRRECRTPLVWVRIAQAPTGGAAELEVVTARSWGSWSGAALAARLLLRVLRRRPVTPDPALAVLHTRRLLLRGEGTVGVTLDGEAFSLRLPLWLAVQEDALRVVVPRETGPPTAAGRRRDATPPPPRRRPGRLRSGARPAPG